MNRKPLTRDELIKMIGKPIFITNEEDATLDGWLLSKTELSKKS